MTNVQTVPNKTGNYINMKVPNCTTYMTSYNKSLSDTYNHGITPVDYSLNMAHSYCYHRTCLQYAHPKMSTYHLVANLHVSSL